MLEIRKVTKIFPGVKALDNVSATFRCGEVHALMGENGAGKSTLMKILTGVYHPEVGEVYIDGIQVNLRNYHDAISHEISMVYQEIQVIPQSTVAENIVIDKLDRFSNKIGLINWRKINQVAQTYLDIVELKVEPTALIGGMTVAQKKLIQIAKALSSNARYILMDEPTSSLTPYESENLFRIIRKLRDEGRSIIFVSHKIEECMSLCDVVTVLRDGRIIGTEKIPDITRKDLIRMMIGREDDITHLGTLNISNKNILEARNIGRAGMFKNISLTLKKGEILGLYGLVGAGRTEFARLLTGIDRIDTGEIYIKGKQVKIRSLWDAVVNHKLGYVTENRKEEGLILSFSVKENVIVTVLHKMLEKICTISTKKCIDLTKHMIDRLEIKTPSENTLVENLSGGNQQKVSLSKWLATDCEILIIDEPTVGVDIGAKRQIHEIIWNLAKNEHKSIILISSDMTEMLTLARRILIFKDYQIVSEINGLNEEQVDYKHIAEQIGAAIV
jgi:ribose transport system ATP-binding protein